MNQSERDDFKQEIKNTISKIFSILGRQLEITENDINIHNTDQEPEALPEGKMAIYMFKYQDQFLKIGKVGPNSNARFQYQHYDPKSAKSTLAKSILNDSELVSQEYRDDPKKWIKTHCQRIDIFFDKGLDSLALSLIEAILHYKYKPKYEGHKYKNL